ncbi:MAG: 2-oxoacid:acceptor oxidoreductase family protein [Spirochaetales bacterium]|nr:2-oxoacid:acceptor oxidoreductase family protein [Spirochaetales bacterium]
MTWKVIFAGLGGQGVVSAGILLGEAAVIHEGRHAVQTQTYGAEMRGGLSRADVTISDEPVMYPKVTQAHILVCMHQKALTANLRLIRPGALLVTDASHVTVDRSTDARCVELPFSRRATEEFGSDRSANICMLGSVASLTEIVGRESLRAAVAERFGTRKRALDAFDLGLSLVEGRVALHGRV